MRLRKPRNCAVLALPVKIRMVHRCACRSRWCRNQQRTFPRVYPVLTGMVLHVSDKVVENRDGELCLLRTAKQVLERMRQADK